ncbi:MAG: YbaB/EbfC family nucleoid-associated protein [Spirochaetes bacterium]|nr:MAG: YbaB/EbfC family nucleoid-associated protein [Spirochaetota bacterium]
MNPMDMLKNIQELQSQMGGMQDKLKTITVTGTSGGDMVQVTMNGAMEVTNVHISPEAVDPDDIRMMEDLILAAFTDANTRIKVRLASEMQNLTGGMNFPPGFQV